ncbi:acyl transferase [Dyadobacter jejuensis]|uniref:acyl transferase n=1 Tax=Dyadobacter jejuensis TaxID=1082580 RepID=UPI000D6C0BA2|nr:acyl transferase [Dyadobacter jejuensis]
MNLANKIPASEIRSKLRRRIFNLEESQFSTLALDIFRYQAVYNPIYSAYLRNLGINPDNITDIAKIPFLPIQFFKTQDIKTGTPPAAVQTFESSGTTAHHTSRHHLYDPELYNLVARKIFESHYGPIENFTILALLPSYLERNNSSLVYMVEHFIGRTPSKYSGFFLHHNEELSEQLANIKEANPSENVLLLGVTFALLDLAEQGTIDLRGFQNLTIMDTGGMKGRRKEWLREEVHDFLKDQFEQPFIHSEYGMTELLSQAYAKGEGLFEARYTMRVLLRDIHDPFAVYSGPNAPIRTGGINVIDLANLDSCSFIETQDLGRFGDEPGTFQVLGRFDNSDIRGCNLLMLS